MDHDPLCMCSREVMWRRVGVVDVHTESTYSSHDPTSSVTSHRWTSLERAVSRNTLEQI